MLDDAVPVEPARGEMRHGLWTRVMRRIAYVDTPNRTAAAFAIGVFLSFSPFFGLQTAIGLSLAFALRLSKVAVFAGLWANLPWIMLPWYALTTAAAAVVLKAPIASNVDESLSQLVELPIYRSAFWTEAVEIVGPFFWSFIIGSTVGAAIVGVAAYFVTARVIRKVRSANAQP